MIPAAKPVEHADHGKASQNADRVRSQIGQGGDAADVQEVLGSLDAEAIGEQEQCDQPAGQPGAGQTGDNCQRQEGRGMLDLVGTEQAAGQVR